MHARNPDEFDVVAPPRASLWQRFRRPLLMIALPLLLLIGGGYLWLTSGRSVSTDNSYVQQDKVSISADVTGRVTAVNVHESQRVKRGDVLFTLDQEPFRIVLEEREAALAQARQQAAQLGTTVTGKGADLAGRRDAVNYAQLDFARQQQLLKEGFTTRARFQQADLALQQARSAYASAQADLANARAMVSRGAASAQPLVMAAQAARDRAALDLRRTVIRAPADGIASQTDKVQAGQIVVSGLPTFSLVLSDSRWIEANFKETDLEHMRIGQPATIKFDAYPGTPLKGHVLSIGAGTGSEFSVLPAQNATGKLGQGRPARAGSRRHRRQARGAAAGGPVGHRHGRHPRRQVASAMATIAAPFPVERAPVHPLLITCVVMLATLLQVLDSTIANVALPHMQASLGAAADTVTWVLTSYIVASAIATPLTGWLAGLIGRKRLFLFAIAGFIGASMLCGLAQSLAQMVGFRLMQGAFGAFLVPLGQAFLLDAYPKEKHGQALALWGVGVMVGPVMGPVLGGWLTDSFDWRWVFYVNVPFGLLALFGALAWLPSGGETKRRFDLFGFTALSIGVGALQLMLDRGQQLDWFDSWEVRIEGMIAISALWMFAVHVATGHDTILDRRLVSDRNVITGFGFITAVGALMVSTAALMPPMLEALYGYPVVTAGLVMAPRGVGTMVGMLLIGRIINRFDPRHLMAFGLLLTAASLWMMSGFSPTMGMGPIIWSGLLQGFGLGFLFVPLNTASFATLAPDLRTDAASFYSLLRNVGASIGVSLVVAILARQTQVSHADIGSALTPYTLPVDPGIAGQLGATGDTALAYLNAQVTMQAAMVGYIDVYWLLMWVTLGTMPLLLLMRRPPVHQVGESPHVALD